MEMRIFLDLHKELKIMSNPNRVHTTKSFYQSTAIKFFFELILQEKVYIPQLSTNYIWKHFVSEQNDMNFHCYM